MEGEPLRDEAILVESMGSAFPSAVQNFWQDVTFCTPNSSYIAEVGKVSKEELDARVWEIRISLLRLAGSILAASAKRGGRGFAGDCNGISKAGHPAGRRGAQALADENHRALLLRANPQAATGACV